MLLVVFIRRSTYAAVHVIWHGHLDFSSIRPEYNRDVAPAKFVLLRECFFTRALNVPRIIIEVLNLLIRGHDVEVDISLLVEFVDIRFLSGLGSFELEEYLLLMLLY